MVTRVEAVSVAAQRRRDWRLSLPAAAGGLAFETNCLPVPERENRLPAGSAVAAGLATECDGRRRSGSFREPAMATTPARRCQQAKHQRLNLARRKKPLRVTPGPAHSLENSAKLEEQLFAREKSEAPVAISSAHAGKRCRLCSYGHRGSTKQKSARKKCRPAMP
jgi:hypothetical protein